MNALLSRAIYKSKKYHELLNQSEYDELLRWCKISCHEGREASKALATAKSYNYRQFKNVRRRNHYDESKYSALSNPEGSGGFCYLTTACLTVLKEEFNDNCYELETLRNFRDTYLTEQCPEDICYYYQIGPKIVEAINKLPYRNNIYKDIYNDLVNRTVQLIEDNQLDAAYKTYKTYSLYLEKTFLLN